MKPGRLMREQSEAAAWRKRALTLGFDFESPPDSPEGEKGRAELRIGTHPLSALLEEYGSPLVVVSEEAAYGVVKRLQAIAQTLGKSLRPVVRIGPSALNDATLSRLFSPVHASPTQDLLRRLCAWNVGFLAQCAGEVERALRAGAKPTGVILCGPFKSKADIILSAQLGLRALEVESLAEFETLCSEEVRAACRLRPLRLCLRLAAPWSPFPAGLSHDEILVLLERTRRLEHVVCVGLSAGWGDCGECSAPEYESLLVSLRDLANDQLASGQPIEYVMVGPRSVMDLDEKGPARAHLESMGGLFENAPFRVYLSCANAAYADATHNLGRALRVVESAGRKVCYVDIRCPEGWPGTEALMPLLEPVSAPGASMLTVSSTGEVPLGAPMHQAATINNRVSILGRASFNHEPLTFGTWNWPGLQAGDAILLPCAGAASSATASACCSLPRPPEILVTQEGEVVVIRSRDTLESVLANEV